MTQKLKRSYSDLEQFAYSTSHDLQEPLRKIEAFGSRLQENLADQMDEENQDDLQRMCKGASRMRELIEGLHQLSRLSTTYYKTESLPLGDVVNEVLSDLDSAIDQSGAQIDVAELPVIDGDRTQLKLLFKHLIVNSIKYQAAGSKPVIKINVASDKCGDDSCESLIHTILLKDNGIGIEEKHQEKIFLPFQRLHSRSEYTGAGMGLAVCRKIAQLHGGDVSASSKPGQGSTFSITLASEPPPEE